MNAEVLRLIIKVRDELNLAFNPRQPRWPKGMGDKSGQWRDDGFPNKPAPRRAVRKIAGHNRKQAAPAKPLNIPPLPANAKKRPLPVAKKISKKPEAISLDDSFKKRVAEEREILSRNARHRRVADIWQRQHGGDPTVNAEIDAFNTKTFKAFNQHAQNMFDKREALRQLESKQRRAKESAARSFSKRKDWGTKSLNEFLDADEEVAEMKGESQAFRKHDEMRRLLKERTYKRREAADNAFWDEWENLGDPDHTGAIGDTRVVQNKRTGQKAIWKRADKDQSDREEVAYHFAQAIGANVPKVERLDKETVKMDFVEGRVGIGYLRDELAGDDNAYHAMLLDEKYDNIAMLDLALGNTDRHHGNFMVDNNGEIWAIDHGYTLQPWDNGGAGAFGEAWRRPGMTPQKISKAIEALEESDLEARMSKMGLEKQYNTAIERLMQLRKDVIARQDGDINAPPAPRAPQRQLGTTSGLVQKLADLNERHPGNSRLTQKRELMQQILNK